MIGTGEEGAGTGHIRAAACGVRSHHHEPATDIDWDERLR